MQPGKKYRRLSEGTTATPLVLSHVLKLHDQSSNDSDFTLPLQSFRM
jgi:hypothetical protein